MRFSPSAAKRWNACPASVLLTEVAEAMELKSDIQSKEARAGTIAAAILEASVKEPGKPLDDVVSELIDKDAFDLLELEDDMLEAVAYARERLLALVGTAIEWGVEHEIAVPQLDTTGRVDFWALMRDYTLYVVDYKHGENIEVRPHDNLQLVLYAYSILDNLRGLGYREKLTHGKDVVLAICQPRKGGWKEIALSIHDIEDRAQRLIWRAKTLHIEAGDHCFWCPATLVCPVRRSELAELDDPNVQISRILEVGSRVVRLYENAKMLAVAKIQAGEEVPGFRLSEPRTTLDWREGAEEALRERYGDAAFVPMRPAAVRDKLDGGRDFVEQWAFEKKGRPMLVRDREIPLPIESQE